MHSKCLSSEISLLHLRPQLSTCIREAQRRSESAVGIAGSKNCGVDAARGAVVVAETEVEWVGWVGEEEGVDDFADLAWKGQEVVERVGGEAAAFGALRGR